MSDEKRTHVRIKMEARVFVEVAAATDTTAVELAHCDVMDVSYGGLQVRIAQSLTPGSILSVCADLPSLPEPFFMAAEVKWCRQIGSTDLWLAGFKLLPASDSDIAAWRELLEDV